MSHSVSNIRLTLDTDIPCHEVVAPLRALERNATLAFPDARQPGALVARAGESLILHFAPGRWLLTRTALDHEADRMERLRNAGALVIGGHAKWCRIEIGGSDARETLSRLLPVDQVLGNRGCAAATLLDCPGVLAASGVGLEFWVGRSWAPWLHDTLTSCLSRRPPRREAGE